MKISYAGAIGEELNKAYNEAFYDEIRRGDYRTLGTRSGNLAILAGVFDGVFIAGLLSLIAAVICNVIGLTKFICKLIKK